jgi:uncharacterized membrane protein (DUF485 family)
MEGNPNETEDTKRENDFRLISDELKRQFELVMRVDDSHNVKLSILLGFVMVVLVQLTLTIPLSNIATATPFVSISFLIGFLAIICSFCLGAIAIYPRTYNYGPRIFNLVEQWENKDEKNYTHDIFGTIWDSHAKNSEITENRADFIQLMLWLFLFGLVFIISSRIAPW